MDFIEPPYEAPHNRKSPTYENPNHEHQQLGYFVPVVFVVVIEGVSCVHR